MDLSRIHFAQGAWLWALLAIPVVLGVNAWLRRTEGAHLLERFADPHLLPYLVRKRGGAGRAFRPALLLWSMAWLFGVLAMAGPRWSYTDQQIFRATQDLVVVLDLSQTMNGRDVNPSRIVRARQEIEDLLDLSRGTSIGLVAYAAVPHMVTPVTDDFDTIRNLLPSLDTSLVTVEGNRLTPALAMAAAMLKAEPGQEKSILVIGDGNFQERDPAALARAAGGAAIYALGVGTETGAPVLRADGTPVTDGGGTPQRSALDSLRLQELASAGHGLYVEANPSDSDTRAILGQIEGLNGSVTATQHDVRVWAEEFFIPVLVLAALLLPWFRKGAAFSALVALSLLFHPASRAEAATATDLFLNKQQQVRRAYDHGDYKKAMKEFDTPYRSGVAAYRAGAYDEAARQFRIAAGSKNGLDALYDLGNAQIMLGDLHGAVASYENVLKRRPGDVAARHNLAVALKMLEENKQPPDKKKQDDKNDDKKKKNDGGNKQNGGQQPQQPGKQGQNGKQDQKPLQQSKNDRQPAQPARQDQQQKNAANPAAQQQRAAQNKPPPGPQGPSGMMDLAPPRSRRDVTADAWLARVQSDPGSFLRNQFILEEQSARAEAHR